MVVIAGIDLAWSGRRPTGVCLLEVEGLSSRVVDISVTPPETDAEAVLHLLAALGPDVVAGIDAPLIVGPNRRAEAELARAYGRFGVFAYAARTDFLDRHRIGEGPRLGALLTASGWDLSPEGVAAEAPGRRALEVFPHATAVSLLGAAFALKYKKGPLAARLGPLNQLRTLLRDYAVEQLPCLVDPAAGGLLTESIALGGGAALKATEDRLDAVACALAAHHAWRHGSEGLTTFGSAAEGYIAVPRPVTSSPEPSCP